MVDGENCENETLIIKQNEIAICICINVQAPLSPILGPFLANEKYLVVADYGQQKIYQLKPDSGEVRAIITRRCRPDTMTFEPSTNVLYMICVEYLNTGVHYYIRKKTFNDTVDEVIYNAPQGKNNVTSMLLSKYHHFVIMNAIKVLKRHTVAYRSYI